MDDDVRWLTEGEQTLWRGWISGTTVLFRALERELLAGFDISLDDYALLVLLSESDGQAARMSALADGAIVPRPHATYRVGRLEKAGLVGRRPCAEDARGTEAYLTAAGMALLERAAALHVTNVRELFLDLVSPEQFEVLGEAMAQVHAALTDHDPLRA